MARGPEAYLQMWERAYGVKPNACTNRTSKLTAASLRSRVKNGFTSWQTLSAAGQPDRRLGNTFSYRTSTVGATVSFSSAGKVTGVKAS
jgi:hypothetical protein